MPVVYHSNPQSTLLRPHPFLPGWGFYFYQNNLKYNFTRDLAAIVFDKPYEIPKERTSIQLPEDILKRYAGEYQLSPTFILSVTVEGNRIYTQATGQERVEIYPASETEFFLTVVEAKIQFTVEDDGTVSGLILHQGGMKIPAERME